MSIRQVALQLGAQGYKVVPVKGKRPLGKQWQKRASAAASDIQKMDWAAADGVGIMGAAVDVDAPHGELAKAYYGYLRQRLGSQFSYRMGLKPKFLVPVRLSSAFKRTTSAKFADPAGKTNQLELLVGTGQWVHTGIHPKAGPYEWFGDDCTKTAINDLIEINESLFVELIDKFEELAESFGFTRQRAAKRPRSPGGSPALADDPGPVPGYDAKRVQSEVLSYLDPDSEYSRWVEIGMALHHQFRGADDGKALFIEWSSQGSKFDPSEDLEAKWRSFNEATYADQPVTLRSLINEVEEERAAAAALEAQGLCDRIDACLALEELNEDIIPDIRSAGLDISDVDRARIVGRVQQAYHRLDGTKVPVESLRKRLWVRAAQDGRADWLTNWVWDCNADRYIDLTKPTVELKERAFDVIHNAEMKRLLGDGNKGLASISAHQYAADHDLITRVDGRRYLPGEDQIADDSGHRFLNTYSSFSIPLAPSAYSPEDLAAIALIERHLELLLGSALQAHQLAAWVAFRVQEVAQMPNWAVIIQGAKGIGKSFLSRMAGCALGPENVALVSPATVQGSFTSWAYNRILIILEELFLPGQNRLVTLNQMKPYITERMVEIHAKGKDPFIAKNFLSVLALTNYRNAIPIDRDDRRYMVVMSPLQTDDQVKALESNQPGYFNRLFGTLEHAGAIRKWLAEMDLGSVAGFDPLGKAPATTGKVEMADAAKDPIQLEIEEIIAAGDSPLITNTFLSATELLKFIDIGAGGMQKIHFKMLNMGWVSVGRRRIGGVRHRIWRRADVSEHGIEWSEFEINAEIAMENLEGDGFAA
ncbi:MAG: PriCT-2 domain-containing protein [Pseudomonadota bacterium]